MWKGAYLYKDRYQCFYSTLKWWLHLYLPIVHHLVDLVANVVAEIFHIPCIAAKAEHKVEYRPRRRLYHHLTACGTRSHHLHLDILTLYHFYIPCSSTKNSIIRFGYINSIVFKLLYKCIFTSCVIK